MKIFIWNVNKTDFVLIVTKVTHSYGLISIPDLVTIRYVGKQWSGAPISIPFRDVP